MRPGLLCRLAAAMGLLAALAGSAVAQDPAAAHPGFELNRHEPTAAGEQSFAVDRPFYARRLAAGFTLNYAHRPLVLADRVLPDDPAPPGPTIEHRLMAHLDLAAAFFDRLQISASLPVVLVETGEPTLGIRPLSGAGASDPRLGARGRLFGQPDHDLVSIGLGLDVWIPLHASQAGRAAQLGETSARVLAKALLGGSYAGLLWSITAGFLYRPVQSIGAIPPNTGNTVGSELQVGAALKCTGFARRLAIGPEVILHTTVLGQGVDPVFAEGFTSVELLLGAHYQLGRQFQLGVAGSVGVGHAPGTPGGRALLRLAYAPHGR